MKKVALTTLLAAVLTLTLSATLTGVSTSAATADPPPPVPRLQREGRNLVDQFGRIVIVHGLNFVWKKAPYAPPDTAEGFTATDAQWLYDHGFNGARLGILWPG
jgi:hypothetical protein